MEFIKILIGVNAKSFSLLKTIDVSTKPQNPKCTTRLTQSAEINGFFRKVLQNDMDFVGQEVHMRNLDFFVARCWLKQIAHKGVPNGTVFCYYHHQNQNLIKQSILLVDTDAHFPHHKYQ
jgi:hypothetical protein